MKELFDKVSVASSKLTTRTYSTSFSLGIYFLNKKLHQPIYSIYAFVRFADEIVDSFHSFDKSLLLQEFKNETYKAIERRISLNPILNAFQEVVINYKIDKELIDCFLNSMEMDLAKNNHSKESYEEYILGSAEVVGLMCLKVFTNGKKDTFEQLKPYAMKLGSAFQKVNFLRDIKYDSENLARIYFPTVNIYGLNKTEKEEIEKEIEEEFKMALIGIKQLPVSSKFGVYIAYVYYKSLFNKIKSIPSERIMNERIRISNYHKISLLIASYFRYNLRLIK